MDSLSGELPESKGAFTGPVLMGFGTLAVGQVARVNRGGGLKNLDQDSGTEGEKQSSFSEPTEQDDQLGIPRSGVLDNLLVGFAPSRGGS